MTDSKIHAIWNPETGINDLESDSKNLSASEMPGIKAVWTDQRARLRGTSQLSNFTEKLSREWAIETGVIENLYEIDRGVTQNLIERGFEAELLSEQISYIGYPPIINAQLTPEIKGLSICSCRRYIQYPWSRIFNIPAGNVLPLRRIELNDASM